MSKNILLLTGSPRKNGNSDLLAQNFIKGAEAAGHKVTLFDAAHKNVMGCKACNKCFSQGKACVFDDDFNEFAKLFAETDMLVFVTPLYWYSFTAQIKAVIDKSFSFIVGEQHIKAKESMLISCGGTEDKKDFEGLAKVYEKIISFHGLTDKGRLFVTGTAKPGDVKEREELVQAEELGKKA